MVDSNGHSFSTDVIYTRYGMYVVRFEVTWNKIQPHTISKQCRSNTAHCWKAHPPVILLNLSLNDRQSTCCTYIYYKYSAYLNTCTFVTG